MKNKKTYTFLWLILSLCIISCDNKSAVEENPTEEHITTNPALNLLTPHFFRPNAFYNLNSPYWFNSQLIKSLKIKTLEISVYSITDEALDSLFPQCEHRFIFDTAGAVSILENTSYYQGLSMGTEQFTYSKKADKYGLKKPKYKALKGLKKEKNTKLNMLEELRALTVYELWDKTKETDHYILYTNKLNPEERKKVFITDTSYWSVIEVDQLQKNYGPIRVCYGTPLSPTSCFELDELVKRTNRISYVYSDEKLPLKMETTEGLFRKYFSFNYTHEGQLTNYTVTTKTPDQSILTDHLWQITYQNDILLSTIVLYTQNINNQEVKTKVKRFSYTFYE